MKSNNARKLAKVRAAKRAMKLYHKRLTLSPLDRFAFDRKHNLR